MACVMGACQAVGIRKVVARASVSGSRASDQDTIPAATAPDIVYCTACATFSASAVRPLALRLRLHALDGGLKVYILKARGGCHCRSVNLTL